MFFWRAYVLRPVFQGVCFASGFSITRRDAIVLRPVFRGVRVFLVCVLRPVSPHVCFFSRRAYFFLCVFCGRNEIASLRLCGISLLRGVYFLKSSPQRTALFALLIKKIKKSHYKRQCYKIFAKFAPDITTCYIRVANICFVIYGVTN